MFNKPAVRTANQSIFAGTSPSEVYRCKGDGPNDYCYIYTTRAGNKQWESVLTVIGREDLLGEERFATPALRAQHAQEIDAMISDWTRHHDKHEVMRRMGEAKVPASAVFDTMELWSDPHLRERGTFVSFEHPKRGALTIPGNMIKLSDSKVPVQCPPGLGEYNQAIYGELLGVDATELEALRQAKVI